MQQPASYKTFAERLGSFGSLRLAALRHFSLRSLCSAVFTRHSCHSTTCFCNATFVTETKINFGPLRACCAGEWEGVKRPSKTPCRACCCCPFQRGLVVEIRQLWSGAALILELNSFEKERKSGRDKATISSNLLADIDSLLVKTGCIRGCNKGRRHRHFLSLRARFCMHTTDISATSMEHVRRTENCSC